MAPWTQHFLCHTEALWAAGEFGSWISKGKGTSREGGMKTEESGWSLVKGHRLEGRNFPSETRRWEKGQTHLLSWRVRAQESAPFPIYQLSDLV